MLESIYNTELNILKANVKGSITINDITSHYNEIAQKDLLPRNLNILVDCRGAKFDMEPKDINQIVNSFKNAIT